MITLGLDIGGANIKAATAAGSAALWPFALWRNPDGLSEILEDLLQSFPQQPIDRLAVTMTGEMCDCFENRAEGVGFILDVVEKVAGHRPVRVWLVEQGFEEMAFARDHWMRAASSNWHALATFAARFAPNALLIDTGSTTTDVIPILESVPAAMGRTDAERLSTNELVYTGVGRTPICAIMGHEVMAEFFASAIDAYLILGDIPDDLDDTNTADGRPAARSFALARMARMLGGDRDTFTEEMLHVASVEVARRQRSMIVDALRDVVGRMSPSPGAVIVSGSGEFLAQAAWIDFAASLDRDRTASMQLVSLSRMIGPELSHTACAYALAVLAQERWP